MTAAPDDSPDLANLANHVVWRRAELDMTQMDVWNAGGPSNSTLTAIESARPPAPSRSTLRKLDLALRWTEGSARSALAGKAPTPIEDARSIAAARVRDLEAEVALAVHDLLEARTATANGGDDQPLRDAEARAAVAHDSLARAQNDLARATVEVAQRDAVGAVSKDADSLLYRRPDGVSDQEWERIRDQSRDYIEWLIDKAARER